MNILVTTDFSENSKSGIRFAISLAKINNAKLFFFNSCIISKQVSWSEASYLQYEKKEIQKRLIRLNKFIAELYRSMNIPSTNYECVIKESLLPESGIIAYAKKQAIDFICIGTRGAGRFKRIFGTTAGNLITKSPIPVIAVPKDYKAKEITNIFFASDFKNYSKELKIVVEFAKPILASIEVFHLTYTGEKLINAAAITTRLKLKLNQNIKLRINKTDLSKPLVANLQQAITSSKPSLVVMFTDQKRSFFQKIFLSSTSESLAFQTKVPLLIFNKIK